MTNRKSQMLKTVRKMLKMDKKTFADFLELNLSRYDEYERGRRCMSADVFEQIADKLGVTLDFLAGKTNCVCTAKTKEEVFQDIKKKIYGDLQ